MADALARTDVEMILRSTDPQPLWNPKYIVNVRQARVIQSATRVGAGGEVYPGRRWWTRVCGGCAVGDVGCMGVGGPVFGGAVPLGMWGAWALVDQCLCVPLGMWVVHGRRGGCGCGCGCGLRLLLWIWVIDDAGL
jgi:hypothetical protein